MDMTPAPSVAEQCKSFRAARQAARLACSGVTGSYALIAYDVVLCDRLQREVAAGNLGFDASKLPACLSALPGAPCSATADPAACDGLFTPLHGPGEACLGDQSCKPGSRCLTISQCPGTCTMLNDVGGPCDGAGCKESLVCDSNGSQTCVMPPTLNQPCPDLDCARGLYCEGITKLCAALKDDGAACTYALECKSDICRGQVCALRGKLNDPCSATEPCSFGLACDGVCKPWQGENAVCHNETDCRPELICTTPGGGDGTCVPWLKQGESCPPTGYRCFPGTVCKTGTCQPTTDCN
jgi:hypothetical protein